MPPPPASPREDAPRPTPGAGEPRGPGASAPTERILQPGRNCWRRAAVGRLCFLVDGERYFAVLADALERARECVWLVGWDFHSEVRLRRPAAGTRTGARSTLVSIVDGIARRHGVHVRILAWDFAMVYALERELLPLLHFGSRTHRRVEFEMDSAHPVGGSQHQKLVVVDDSMAFVGGLDLTASRWDTREHRADEPRRTTPHGTRYPPFHDVQLAVDGDAARALAGLARERWQRATGLRVAPCAGLHDPWPRSLEPDVRNVEVGIARTQASYHGAPEVREIEHLYHDGILAARRSIYLENQFLSAHRVIDWLCERLREDDGPEVVIVGPRENRGWLEERVMGALRGRAARRLREADLHQRLRLYYPHRKDLAPGETLNVHAKVMVIDDVMARVGSSNLSNRSLGLDSECDLALEARPGDAASRAIRKFRDGLLAEHLGVPPAAVAREMERTHSLVATIESLRGGDRSLRVLEPETEDWAAATVETLGAFDPEHPVPLEELVDRFLVESEPAPPSRARRLWSLATALLVIGLLVLTSDATPLGHDLVVEATRGVLGPLRAGWSGAALAVLVFAGATLLLVPVTALTIAATLLLGGGAAIPVAWLGSIAGASAGYALGQRVGRGRVRRLAGDRLDVLSRRLQQAGVLSCMALRLVPKSPFMLVSLVAGATRVPLRDFVLGTAIGVLPGILSLALVTDALAALAREPTVRALLFVGAMILGVTGMLAALYRVASRFARHPAEPRA